MDGLARSDDLVFVLAATNLPWELDAAMLRRLEKRVKWREFFNNDDYDHDANDHAAWQILVPLPEPEARKAMFEELLGSGEEIIPYDFLVESTEGYSGSDIRLICKEAAMHPLRRLMAHLEGHEGEIPDDGTTILLCLLFVFFL